MIFVRSMCSAEMYGLRSIHAPVLQYLATSSGYGSMVTSGAVPLFIARRTAWGCFPGVESTVIQGYFFWKSSSTDRRCPYSGLVKAVHSVIVTGAWEPP